MYEPATSAAPRLHLRLIGGVAVERLPPDERILRPALALLGCLALTEGMKASRDRLAALLWDKAEAKRARGNLRQVIYALRQSLPPPAATAIIAERHSISLDPARVTTDAGRLLKCIDAGDVPDQMSGWLGEDCPLMEGFDAISGTLADWLRLQRRAFTDRLREGLHRILAEGGAKSGQAAHALARLDPSDEIAARKLMRAAALAADPGQALAVYRALWDHLDREFGAEPSDETQALVVAIKQGGEGPPLETAAAARVPGVGRTDIWVAPLEPLDCEPQAAALAALLRAELVNRLARFREFRVRDGTMGGASGSHRMALVATGQGGRMALVATLARRDDGTVLWSERFDRGLADWGGFLEGAAGSLAAACGIGLSRARLTELLAGAPCRDAADEFLLGQAAIRRFRPDDWAEAESRFRRAAALDPGYARAWSSLSQSCNVRHLAIPGERPDPARLRRSLDFANRAIDTDPRDSQAHLSRAWAAMLLRRFGDAENSFENALDLNPDDPWTVISSSLGAGFAGRREAAAAGTARFRAEGWITTPVVWGYYANIRFLAGDLEGCVAAAENARPGLINLPAWQAAALALMGRDRQAAQAWRDFETLARADWRQASPPTTTRLLDWFLSSFPIRDASDRARLERGVRKAITGTD